MQQATSSGPTSRSTQLPEPNIVRGTLFSSPMPANGLTIVSTSRIRDWLMTTPGYFPLSVKSRKKLELLPSELWTTGKTKVNSEPEGVSGKVGLMARTSMFRSSGGWGTCGPSIARRRVATVTPDLRGCAPTYERSSGNGMSSDGRKGLGGMGDREDVDFRSIVRYARGER